MKKNILKSLLTMVCLLCGINASAYDFEVDGIYYDVVSLTDFTCKVVSKSASGYNYEGDIVIPPTVNYSSKTLSVVEIASGAFRGCKITSITIPKTVTSIGDNALYNCQYLARIIIEDGESVLNIGKESIGASNIVTLYLGRNLSWGGYKSTFNRATLKELTIGNSVTEIGSYMFEGCTGITSVTIPNSVVTIGDYAFHGCGLTDFTIPESVSEIGKGAFQSCAFTSIIIPNSVPIIEDYTFAYCSRLTNVVIGNSVTEIGLGAFQQCEALTSVTIPNSVVKIRDGAFEWCKGLTSVEIGNSVTEIGNVVFAWCDRLTSVTFPASVTKIGESVFSGCKELTSLYSLNPIPPSTNNYTFTTDQYMSLNVFVPQEALAAYQEADNWKTFWNLQSFTPTGIENVKVESGKDNEVYYDLRGNRLNAPKRGLNIINGKKVIVK